MMTLDLFERMSDTDLLSAAKRLAHGERQAMADLIQTLAAIDARRLYLGEGCASLFTWCTRVLRLSEHAAWGRIEAARAARQHPIVIEMLREGAITLTTVTLLKPHLTDVNHREVLEAARHKSKREVERLVAMLRPQPDVPASIRRLPPPAGPRPTAERACPAAEPSATADPGPGCADAAGQSPAGSPPPAHPADAPLRAPCLAQDRTAGRHVRPTAVSIVKPLAPERYRIQFTISRDTHDILCRVQDLLRYAVPDADPAAVFDRALRTLLAQLERRKLAATDTPRAGRVPTRRTRHIPAPVRRGVWARDAGRCAFLGSEGRCEETARLEVHHRVPYADGGPATVENLELRCRAHNAYEAEQWFGPLLVRELPAAF